MQPLLGVRVTASRGKVLRAEPVSAFYGQSRVHHVGSFPELETQMCGFASNFDRAKAGYSPDRVDAFCFALTELIGGASYDGWLKFYELEAGYADRREALPTQPQQDNAEMPQATITMRTRPWADFYIGTRRYTADKDGLIRNVAREHVEPLRRNGCEELREDVKANLRAALIVGKPPFPSALRLNQKATRR